MLRRVSLVLLLGLICATAAWSKIKPEDQEYFDNKFQVLQDQIQLLKKQNEALAAQLVQLQQNQAAFQSSFTAEQKKLDELEQLISSMRLGSEENFASVKTSITKLHDEQEKSFNDLIGRGTQAATTTATPATPPPAPAVKGYVTVVKGDTVTIDVGATQGIRVGSRLQVFKPTDLNTPVGEIEVTEVTGSGSSKAHVVSLNPDIKIDFSDQVRLEP